MMMKREEKAEHKMAKKGGRPSEDSAIIKQIQATHRPDGTQVDVQIIFQVIEDILLKAHPTLMENILQKQETGNLASAALGEDTMEQVSYIVQKISCELSHKCGGGQDTHGTTMSLLTMLSTYEWEAKLAISLAVFAANYGELCLAAQLSATDPMAETIYVLKRAKKIEKNANQELKSLFSSLIKTGLDVTKCIIELLKLPSKGAVSTEKPPFSEAVTHFPVAVYWAIQCMVASQVCLTSLINNTSEFMIFASAKLGLSGLAHKLEDIHGFLDNLLKLCVQEHDYNLLEQAFVTGITHSENSTVLDLLFTAVEDVPQLYHGSGVTVNTEELRGITVLLLISTCEDDQPYNEEALIVLRQVYEMREIREKKWEMVWIPVTEERITKKWDEREESKYSALRSEMPWCTVRHPRTISPAFVRYVKEAWHFSKRPMIVTLDPSGKVACKNAMHMIFTWGGNAYPFTSAREGALWREEKWSFEFILDGIDPIIFQWISEEKHICLYGGADIEWIRRFTTTAKAFAAANAIDLEMIYIGKRNGGWQRHSKIVQMITTEKLSVTWPESVMHSLFWRRLESIWYSKLQRGRTVKNDDIMREVSALLSFGDAGDGEKWAVIGKGIGEVMARATGERMLMSLTNFEEWKHHVGEVGFVPALAENLQKLHTRQHCVGLDLPRLGGAAMPEKVECTECGRTMVKFCMYRCTSNKATSSYAQM